jgi:hypothetical protein
LSFPRAAEFADADGAGLRKVDRGSDRRFARQRQPSAPGDAKRALLLTDALETEALAVLQRGGESMDPEAIRKVKSADALRDTTASSVLEEAAKEVARPASGREKVTDRNTADRARFGTASVTSTHYCWNMSRDQEPNPSSGPQRGFFKDAAVSLSSDSGY